MALATRPYIFFLNLFLIDRSLDNLQIHMKSLIFFYSYEMMLSYVADMTAAEL